MEKPIDMTQTFLEAGQVRANHTSNIIRSVSSSLEGKNYNPLNQLVGYLMSGDPTYITSYNDARKQITSVDRDELMEEIVKFYLSHN